MLRPPVMNVLLILLWSMLSASLRRALQERPAVVSDSCNNAVSLATSQPAYNSAKEASCLACLPSPLSLSSSLSATQTHQNSFAG